MAGIEAFLHDKPWVGAMVAALVAVVAALVVHRILAALLTRATRHTPVFASIVAHVIRPGSAVLPLLALQAVWQAMPDDMRHMGIVRHANGVLLIAALTWLAMGAVSGLAAGIMARHPLDVEDNLNARRVETQARILSRSASVLILIAGAAIALMTFPGARHVGASLLASAGVIGIVGGLAARPVFSNLIAGLQIALAQPLRMDDVLVVKGEYGRVEEITGTYVVLRIWDDRRLIVPLQWFIENPFENYTRSTAKLFGTVVLHLNQATPVDILRERAKAIVEASPDWDKRRFNVQVQEVTEGAMQLRIVVSASDGGKLWNLRCHVREEMLAFMAANYPHYLPPMRAVEARPPA